MRTLEKYFSSGMSLAAVVFQEYFMLFEGSKYYLPRMRGYHAAAFYEDLLHLLAARLPAFLEPHSNGKLIDWRFRQLHSPLYRFLRHSPPEGVGLFTAEVFAASPGVLQRRDCSYTVETALQAFQTPQVGSRTEYDVYHSLYRRFQKERINISI